MQSTPVAVTAVTSAAIDKQQLVDISALSAAVPNLVVSSAVAQPGSATLFMRGQGSLDGLIAIDQAIGVYVNGVYAARSTGGLLEFFDVAQVEVLRGPQGTLFGRNTTGGAVNVITTRPSQELEGSARVDVGNYNHKLFRGVLNLPVNDAFAVRAAYQHKEQDGFGKNLLLDRETGGFDNDYLRLTAEFSPEDAPYSVLLAADRFEMSTAGETVGLKSWRPTQANQAVIAACSGQIPGAESLAQACPYGRPGGDTYDNYLQGNGLINDFHDTFSPAAAYGEVENYGFSATVDADLSETLYFKSITGVRGVEMASLTDNDGTPYVLTGGVEDDHGNFIKQSQFSQELQLNGTALDSRLSWIVGLYYFIEEGDDDSISGALFPINPAIGYVDAEITNKSRAVFAQLNFDLSERLRMTTGLRYTEDEREMISRNRDRNAFTGAESSSLPPETLDGDPNDPFRATFKRDYDYWSSMFGLDYQISDSLFSYLKVSRAYRSGGLNTRVVAGGTPPIGFDPEEVTDVEVGAKFDFWEGRGRLNTAVFHTDFKDIQRNLTGVTDDGRLVSGIDNAAEAVIQGAEFELQLLPVENLTLSANVGLTVYEYKEFINSINGQDLSDTPFIYSPEMTYGVSADYDIPMSGDKLLNLNVNYAYKDDMYALALKDPELNDEENRELRDTAKMDGYGLLNLRLALSFGKSDVEVALWGRNVLDKEYETRLLPLENTPLGITSYQPGAPRTFGVSISKSF
nr:TonB-dependent receptor [Spongiibacter thalassae]